MNQGQRGLRKDAAHGSLRIRSRGAARRRAGPGGVRPAGGPGDRRPGVGCGHPGRPGQRYRPGAGVRGGPAPAVAGHRRGAGRLAARGDGAAGTDWALASFEPSASAGKLGFAAEFADGAATGVFRRTGGVWHLVQTGPYGCGAGLPTSLKQAWGLAGPATCSASAATGHSAAQHALSALPASGTGISQAIASVALKQVGVASTPAETSFSGVDCDPFSTMVAGFSSNADGCGYDTALQGRGPERRMVRRLQQVGLAAGRGHRRHGHPERGGQLVLRLGPGPG